MKLSPVPASTNIKEAGFENGVMQIRFSNGRLYQYTGPKVEEHYKAMLAAERPSSYFFQNIRACPHTAHELILEDPKAKPPAETVVDTTK
jgi:hypothetical protein